MSPPPTTARTGLLLFIPVYPHYSTPVHFLEFLIMRPAYYTCVLVEATGLTHICWLLSYLMGIVFGMRADCDDVINVNKDEKVLWLH